MKSAKHFYDSIFPSIAISLLFGITPIFIKTQNNEKMLYTHKYLYLINIAYTTIFSVLVVRTINETRSSIMSNSYYQNNRVSNIGIAFVFSSGILYTYLIYICGFYRTESIKTTLKRFAKLDVQLERLGQELNYKTSIIYQLSTQSAALLLICIVTTMQYTNVRREHFRELSITTWVVFISPAVIVNIFENQFAYTVLLIYQRFKIINQRLKRIVVEQLFDKSEEYLIANKVNSLMKIHDELCDIARTVNTNYTLQEIVVLTFQFGILLFSVFYSYWMFGTKPFSAICWIMWSTLKATEVLHVTISCHLTTVQAKFTGTVIHKALLKSIDEETKSQLMAFSNQIIHRKVNFTIWGIINLNATLLFTMVAGASTFMVIMLEFQQASMPMLCKTSASANVTVI